MLCVDDDELYEGYVDDTGDDELYEGYEEGVVNDIEGITDSISDLSYTGISFPAIIFGEGFRLERHKASVIRNMVESNASGFVKDISLYYTNNGELYRLGAISGYQVMPLLDIVPMELITAYYSDGTPLNGSLIYTLCSF